MEVRGDRAERIAARAPQGERLGDADRPVHEVAVRREQRQRDVVGSVVAEGEGGFEGGGSGACDDDVEHDDMLRLRHDAAGDLGAGRGLRHPRLAGLDIEENGAGESHGPQHVRQYVHPNLLRTPCKFIRTTEQVCGRMSIKERPLDIAQASSLRSY